MLAGLLGTVSAVAKLRARVRSTIGYSPVSVAELLVGTVALVGSGVGFSRVRPVAWTLVVLAIGLTLFSTWTHIRLLGRYVKRREQAEALRLQTYLNTCNGDSTSS